MGKNVVCLSQGVADPAAKRALRALEEALNQALARLDALETSSTSHETQLEDHETRIAALEP